MSYNNYNNPTSNYGPPSYSSNQGSDDKSMRSVFVGNIPYSATEDSLRDIFSEVGNVISFKIVHDRDTGRSKGFGFCEYQNEEMAKSAMRNLNGYEYAGRSLRVDNPSRNSR